MRNYIILNGKNSNEIAGLLIQNLPPISKPLQRTLVEEIDGRDGDIVTKLGYGAYDKEFSIGLYGNYDVDQVISYFNSEGVVTFSNEPDKYYNYQIIDQIDFERLIRFKTAIVRMHVQPFKYLKDEEQIRVDAQNLSGEGTDIKLEYTTKDAALKIEPKGNTHQDSYTGKNLNVYPYATQSRDNGITFTINEDGTIILNGQNNNNGNSSKQFYYNLSNPRILEAGTYYMIPPSNNAINYVMYDGTSYYDFNANNNYSRTFDRQKAIQQFYVQVSKGNTTTFTNEKIYPMLSITPVTIDDYEPYVGGTTSPNPDFPQDIRVVTGDNTINIHGKNLLDITLASQTKNGVNVKVNEDNSITLSGTATSGLTLNLNYTIGKYIHLTSGETYTISIKNNNGVYLRLAKVSDNSSVATFDSPRKDITFTSNYTGDCFVYLAILNNTTFNNLTIYPMIALGTNVTEYQPYQSKDYEISLGSLELCKIGNYQDYIYKENNKWYKHSEIGKLNVDTSTITIRSNYTNIEYAEITKPNDFIGKGNYDDYNVYCSHAISDIKSAIQYAWDSTYRIGKITNKANVNALWLGFSKGTGLDNIKTALNGAVIYYALATPTETKITDDNLIEQLEALDQAKTMEETTYISSSSESNLPFLLTASAKGMNNTIIENIGNIFAKPIITIYGSGEVAVYLDKVQILQIDLADSGSITIDVSKLEAYNKDTNELMNRSVIGDYSNLKIQCGENELTFSGNVTGFTMDKYTRWL